VFSLPTGETLTLFACARTHIHIERKSLVSLFFCESLQCPLWARWTHSTPSRKKGRENDWKDARASFDVSPLTGGIFLLFFYSFPFSVYINNIESSWVGLCVVCSLSLSLSLSMLHTHTHTRIDPFVLFLSFLIRNMRPRSSNGIWWMSTNRRRKTEEKKRVLSFSKEFGKRVRVELWCIYCAPLWYAVYRYKYIYICIIIIHKCVEEKNVFRDRSDGGVCALVPKVSTIFMGCTRKEKSL
jgi:hypothetical protein